MEPDFLTDFEDTLSSFPNLDEIDRMQVDSNGEGGTLLMRLDDGREYSITFQRR